MNALGKLFVVLIFVMSIVFMSFSMMVYATHKNWYQVVMNQEPGQPKGLKFQVQELRQVNQDLKNRLDSLRQEFEQQLAARTEALAKLETERQILQQERDERQRQLTDLVQNERQAVAAMDAAHKTLASLREEVDRLRTNYREVQEQKNESFQQLVRLTDELNVAQNQLDTLKQVQMELNEQVARQKMVLERHNLDEFEPADGLPPDVDGIVTAVGRAGMIEISIGQDDGLRPGHTLEVYRRSGGRSRYVGRVEVVRTEPDRAAAKILPEYRKAAIQIQDRVATRLN